MSEENGYICLLGIDPKEVQKCNASECLLAAGKRRKQSADAPTFANTA